MGRWLPATEARLTFLNHAKEALGNPEASFHYPLSVIRYPLSIIHYPLSIIHFPLSIIHYPFSIIHFPFSIFHFPFLISHFWLSISRFPPDRMVLRSDGFSLGVAPFEPIFWAGISVGNSNSGVDFPLDNGIPLHRALRGFAYTRMTLGAIRLKSEAAETVL